MGTITQRKRADGSISFRAQVRVRQGNEYLHGESKTFTKRALAQEWIRRREFELEKATASGEPIKGHVTLKQILEDYVSDAKGSWLWGASRLSIQRRSS